MAENVNSQEIIVKPTEEIGIENIQCELNDLIKNINDYIDLQHKQDVDKDFYEYTSECTTLEKGDGPSEKFLAGTELFSDCLDTGIDLCAPGAELPVTEVDWSVAGPILQKHVNDLEQLHTLNVATSSLIRRVKQLALKKSIALLQDEGNDEENDLSKESNN